MKRLLVCLLPVGVVGCGKNNKSANKPGKELTIEDLSGTHERKDGIRFQLVIENSGTFKDHFDNFLENTFVGQADRNCKTVDKEVHFSYQTPADFPEAGVVHINRVQQNGSLAQIAAIADGKRHGDLFGGGDARGAIESTVGRILEKVPLVRSPYPRTP